MLILRDVIGWSANDTAPLLDDSVAAVKSALQGARATLNRHLPRNRLDWAPTSDPSATERALLERYMAAYQPSVPSPAGVPPLTGSSTKTGIWRSVLRW